MKNSAFRVVRRGYAPDDVDDRLEALAAELERSRAELRAARYERDNLRQEVVLLRQRRSCPSGDGPPGNGPPGDSDRSPATDRGSVADKIVRVAQREALAIRANAYRQAATLVDAAQAHALREHDELRRRLDAELGGLRKQITDSLADLHALDRPAARPAADGSTVSPRTADDRPGSPPVRVVPSPVRRQDIR